jgi:hypothetical protein
VIPSVDLGSPRCRVEAVIWIDLDKTLVYVRDKRENQTLAMLAPFWGISADVILRPSRKGRRKLRSVTVRGLEWRGCLRHCAHDFLEALRSLTEVRMLTSASRPYAKAMNVAFKLGFKNTQIFAREDWMRVRKNARATGRAHGIDVDGVLIDNETDDWIHRQKIGYLGARGRLVTVEDFTGFVQDSFTTDWPRHVQQVRDLLRETGAETNARLSAEIDRMLAAAEPRFPDSSHDEASRK